MAGTATPKTVANGLFRPEFWSKELLRNLDNTGVMLDCVNRDYEGEIKNAGDTVHIQKAGDITVNPYTPSTSAITYEALTGETDTLVIDKQQYWGFHVPDIDKVQANVPLAQKYMNRAKVAIANTKDAFLLAKAQADAGNTVTVSGALAPNNVYGTLVKMFEKLARANAIGADGKGEDGKRPFIVLPPEIIAIIKQSPEATHATVLGDDVVRKGTVMTYAGFDVKQSTVFAAPTSSEAGVIIAGTTEAITYADQIIKTETVKDKDYFGDYIRGLYVYGALTVQPDCLVTASVTI